METLTKELVVGREMDALIAEKVMGGEGWEQGWNPYRNCPHYSTDIAAAWQVVEHSLKQEQWGFHSLMEGWTAAFFIVGRCSLVEVSAPTAPEAICRAALKAAGS